MTRPTVICLIGTSRCGSTVLQHVLEAHEGVAAAGEIQRLEQLKAQGTPCACGEAVDACPVWSAVGAQSPAPGRHQRPASLARRLTTIGAIVAAVSSGKQSLAPASEREAAARLADCVEQAALRLGAGIIVDSSKDIDHFARLALGDAFDLIPVHVVRDPRGVVHSAMTRTQADPAIVARHWQRVNRAGLWLARLTPRYPWRIVRYEDFCEDPLGVAGDILRAAGQLAPLPRLTPAQCHALGGSPGFEAPDPDAIRTDERWRIGLTARLAETTWQRTGRLAIRLGYEESTA